MHTKCGQCACWVYFKGWILGGGFEIFFRESNLTPSVDHVVSKTTVVLVNVKPIFSNRRVLNNVLNEHDLSYS